MQYVHGIKVICTAHGANLEGLKLNKNLNEMINLNFFERIIFLKATGKRGEIDIIYSF